MGAISDQVKKLTSDPGARWLAGVTDELDAKVKELQAKVDSCCGGDSLGLKAANGLNALEAKHAELTEAHKALEAKHAELTEAHKALEAKLASAPCPTPSPATPQ